jgi:hypothetical protein
MDSRTAPSAVPPTRPTAQLTRETRPAHKVFADAQAHAALLGAELHKAQGDDGRPLCVLTRGPYTQSFSSLADVDRLLAGIGAEVRG